MEPRTMRHLLQCLYTDQLPPDLTDDDDNDSTYPTQQARDLVALFVAADRYLVTKAQTLVTNELRDRFDHNGDNYNVLPVFDLALAVAPELATSACQPFIEAHASLFLGNRDEDIEAQWLDLSEAAAARVVGMDLERIDEIDVFRAVQRRYEHHLAEAEDRGHGNNGDEKSKKTTKKREAAIAEAKKKVAGQIKGINTNLMSVEELTEIVEPSGLFTNALLASAFRDAALTQRFFVQELYDLHNLVETSFFLEDRKKKWSVDVQEASTTEPGYEVNLRIKSSPQGSTLLPYLSAEGVTITIYCGRRRVKHYCATASTAVPVPGVISVPFTARRESGRVTILVRVPPTAFTKSVKK